MIYGRIRDDIEKEDAFRGLCAMVCTHSSYKICDMWTAQVIWAFPFCFQVRANPSGGLSSLIYMCKAIASWHVCIQSLSSQN